MRVFRTYPNRRSYTPCVLTIGNFDGVHRGHQILLARARQIAAIDGLPICVVTFEPHPHEFFNPNNAPPRIMLLRDRLDALQASGVDWVIVEHFNAKFAHQSPDHFVQRTIVNGLHAHWVIVGDDFRYGAKRVGNFATLKAAGEYYGFHTECIPTVTDADGVRISSSAVRAAMTAGKIATVNALLNRYYLISGHVIHGNRLGHRLGFPTLNLRIAYRRFALAGIFVVRVHGLSQQPLPGVASLGRRPTVDTSGRLFLEAHILDWEGNAYGKLVRIEFLKKLRNEEKYADLTLLTRAIAEDVAQARAFFNQGSLSDLAFGVSQDYLGQLNGSLR